MMKKILCLFFCLMCFVLVLGCSKALPLLGKLSDFRLENQEGKSVSPESFRGKILAANFIFTSCAGTCPLLTERMKKVQDFIQSQQTEGKENPFHIVSFSVDPERDTPERLRDYMKSYGVDSQVWSFLTGPYQEIEKVVVEGFKVSMGKVPAENSETSSYDVIHGEKFILIDGQGEIRGYFDATEAGIYQLTQAMSKLAKQ